MGLGGTCGGLGFRSGFILSNRPATSVPTSVASTAYGCANVRCRVHPPVPVSNDILPQSWADAQAEQHSCLVRRWSAIPFEAAGSTPPANAMPVEKEQCATGGGIGGGDATAILAEPEMTPGFST
eukprot:3461774-Prymnesium_polylepis.1